ncbi:hypothetical protein JQ557_07560 [Bradyrhizobium sp. U87765 SZCCT0131]|uniref:hypothetical protein n=1 Tax=unclassified Bradyrhizobium TaxID=2631580 RepID=UPI001BA6EE81|nr:MULTISPECIES: hypothetical protein [unclassified Bradyrhizobium]MBR1217840.1 hypothetical protein [Bradyrhizobium sp. U87765 SZCCT0131]MBR1261214.1 hypothetical protein [Bradyrhizobium sp. U87765 SZCCT0134]MBR1303338.1 hypothetical protein [Bradyrhizobium sp. U87765 SZCCT0110]MBR1318944.1 hypothetical protein [Bradyrhizobium sp. U87765 SZCCT0109]MBR1347269.1 hypothetical protein [Bradyrhizobium sp. U87765 SZCCT0048]
MSASKLHLHGCRYALGEDVCAVADLPDLQGFLDRHQMIHDAALWGWGSYCRTRSSAVDIGLAAAQQSVAAFAGRRPIDAVVLCGTRFPGDVDGHADIVGRFLEALDLPAAAPYGTSLNRCATLMAGLRIAQALLLAGLHEAVLVAAFDALADEDTRLRHFAIFSDGAASFIVTRDLPGDFELIDTAVAIDAAAMRPGAEISAALTRQAHADIASRCGVAVGDVKHVAHNNLFRPIVAIKEQQAGFAARQLFLDNVTRIGHVSACDPIINLVDLAARGALSSGDLVALGSSVSGARFAGLVRMM